MTFNEIVNEVREYRANQEFLSANFSGRSVPENTRTETGFVHGMVWQQGNPCGLSWIDCATVVMRWTDIPENVLSATEVAAFLSNSGPSISYMDPMLEFHNWL